jgi:hypothetical protein
MADTLRIKRRALGGSAGAPGSLAVGELAFNEVDGGLYIGRSNATVVQVNGAVGGGGPILNYLGGLTLSNDATTPNTVLDIATGTACSDDNTTMMSLATAAFKKNCNAAWAVGSGNGALDSGSALVANAWYHVFLIERTDTGVVDVLISLSATAPTMPTSYTKKRRIGSIKTDGSVHILAFSQLGDEFLWAVDCGWDIASNGAVAVAPGTLIVSPNIPLGVKVVAIINSVQTVIPANGQIRSPDEPAVAGAWNYGSQGGSGVSPSNQFRIRTNTAAQIRLIGVSAIASGIYMGTIGWYDNRGK